MATGAPKLSCPKVIALLVPTSVPIQVSFALASGRYPVVDCVKLGCESSNVMMWCDETRAPGGDEKFNLPLESDWAPPTIVPSVKTVAVWFGPVEFRLSRQVNVAPRRCHSTTVTGFRNQCGCTRGDSD